MNRDGLVRPNGIDGNPSQTAYRLLFYFPLFIWFLMRNITLKSLLFISILVAALLLLNTRAVLY